MTNKIHCPHCGTPFELTDDLFGRSFACPVCGVPFSVDAEGAVLSPTPAPSRQAPPAAKAPRKVPRKVHVPNNLAEEPPRSHAGCFIFVLLLLLLAGGGAYWWFRMRPAPAPEPAPETVEALPEEPPPLPDADALLRRALEKTVPDEPETVRRPPVLPDVGGSTALVKSRFAWTPRRPETRAPFPACDLETSTCVKERRAVLVGADGALFTTDDVVTPVRRNASIIQSYAKDTLAGAPPGVRLANVRTHLFALVGVDALKGLAAREGGVDFLEAFFNDVEWMEEFAGSGAPFNLTERRAFHRLSMLVWNDPSNWILTSVVGRRLATALVLNGADAKRADLIARFRMYASLYRRGRLTAAAARYTVREWREALAPDLSVRDLAWLNGRASLPPAQVWSLTNNVAAASNNCFGARYGDSACYGLWSGVWPQARVVEQVGGRAADRLYYAVRLAQAQGIAAYLADGGAALVRTAPGDWSLQETPWWDPAPDWSEKGLLGSTRGEILASARVFADEDAWRASERLRWLAATRARQFRATGWSERVDATYFAALETCPRNVLAWRDYRDWLEKNKVGPDVWRRFGKAAAQALADVPPFAYEMARAWFAQLKASDAAPSRRLAALREVHALLREPAVPWSGEYGFERFLSDSADMLENDPALLLEFFDTVALAQLGTPHFFEKATVWAGRVFMKDAHTAPKFLARIEKWADPDTYTRYSAQYRARRAAAGWQPKPPKVNWTEFLYAAAEAGNVEGLRAAMPLAKRYAKKDLSAAEREKTESDRDKKADKVPSTLFGAPVVSAGAWPLAHPVFRVPGMNRPLDWESFADPSPAGKTRVCVAPTNEPAITLALPRLVEGYGILIKNVDEDLRRTARQSPLVVEVSKDGQTWRTVWQEAATNATVRTAPAPRIRRSPYEKRVAVRERAPAAPAASGFGRLLERPDAPAEPQPEECAAPRMPEPAEWRIDLTALPKRPRMRYVRVRRAVDGPDDEAPFALDKIVVYGRKARADAH